MFITILRISAMIFSLYGYALFFREKIGFREKVSWVAGVSFITLVLYFAAYLNWLKGTGIGLFIIGCFLALVFIYKKVKEQRLKLASVNAITIWLLFYFLLFAATFSTSHLEHYDNYSHWAIIVKFLYTQGRLPAAGDTIISFSSYPMGSSLFVYYTTLIGGFSDSVMLIGQFISIFSCLYALFAIVRDESRTLISAMMFSFIAIFNHFNIAIRMNNLLVDFLLPLITLAGIAGIYRMRSDLKQMSLFLVLIAGALSIQKNSAMFFTAVIIIYYLFLVARNWKGYGNKLVVAGTSILTLAASAMPYFLWNFHVKNTLTASKHEVDVEAYQQIFGEKDPQTIQQISDTFVSTITDLSTPSTQGILLANGLMLLAYSIIRFKLKRKNSILGYLFIVNLLTAGYYLGIYFMFLFSMPTQEALYLAGFERYSASMVILALGITMFVLAREIDYSFYEQNIQARNYRSFKSLATKKKYQLFTVLGLFFATLMLLSENNGMKYNQQHFSKSVPAEFMKVADNEMTLNQDRYLVVSPNKDQVNSYLVGYVGKYYLYSPNVDAKENFLMEDEEFIQLLEGYDKLVILDEHYTFNAMTEKLFDQVYEPGVYEVATLLD